MLRSDKPSCTVTVQEEDDEKQAAKILSDQLYVDWRCFHLQFWSPSTLASKSGAQGGATFVEFSDLTTTVVFVPIGEPFKGGGRVN